MLGNTTPLPFPSVPRGADRLNHIFISCPLSVRALPAIDTLSDNGYEGQTGISVCPTVFVWWLILHIIMAINQPVNISDCSHLHRGNGEKKTRGKQMRNGDVEEMIKLSTARRRHSVSCRGLYALHHCAFVPLFCLHVDINNMTPSLKENIQGVPQSSFNASVHNIYNICSVQCIINYI